MNVWVALMNLENTYGGEEALMKLVEKALLYTNQKKLYFHLVDIFRRSKNYKVNIPFSPFLSLFIFIFFDPFFLVCRSDIQADV